MKKMLWVVAVAVALGSIPALAEVTKIDEFNGSVNLLGCRHNCYQAPPSRAMASIVKEEGLEGEEANRCLKIQFDKQNTGGKFGKGGWCGWYTLFYQSQSDNPQFLSVEGKSKLTFRVRGEQGGENFRMNLKDRDGEVADTPPPPIDIGSFLPEGRVTTEWQKVEVPLDTYYVDLTKVASFSINFEHDCYPDGSASGTIYIDDLAFE